jgi:hypothetical protein
MATNLSVCHPGDGIEALNRLPGLAEPLLHIDLERELQQLRQEDSWQRETGRSSKTLAKYPDFRIVLIMMKGGTRMRQHRAEGRISIQELKGRVRIHLADRTVDVSAGHLLASARLWSTTRRRSLGRECNVANHFLAKREECLRILFIYSATFRRRGCVPHG